MSFGALALLLLIEALYVRAIVVLRRRGWRVPGRQQLAWHFGMTLQAVALLGPLDTDAAHHLSSHMAQHLLLADIAVPFLLAGIRTPALVFVPPRPLLVALARRTRLRAAFRVLRRPAVAVAVYLGVLYFWHLGFAFQGALRHPAVHALQHLSFIAIGVLIWWAALEPQRARLRGELWKIPYIIASRMISMFLGMALIFSGSPWYGEVYGRSAAALSDQRTAGGIMMSVDVAIIVAALIFFFYRASADHDAAEHRAAATAT